jgi:hypothetical protein
MSICRFVLVTIACAFSCKLERECQDRLGKKRFEQWLYDTAYAEVKHFHGDNGIFASEQYRQECMENGQTQSFSGVGAQHQKC